MGYHVLRFVRTCGHVARMVLLAAWVASAAADDVPRVRVDWPAFLARHDMVWQRLPTNWREAPWTGNGMLGSMLWFEGNELRVQVFRGDVQTHRPMTQGMACYTRSRLQIGSFYLTPAGAPTGCDLRLRYHDAELAGTIATERGSLRIGHFAHAEDMAIVLEIQSEDEPQPIALRWEPAVAMPTRTSYARSEEDLPKVRARYRSEYPTEVFAPNPDPVLESVGDVNVCIQDQLGGARHGTAWTWTEVAPGRYRLVVSIGNRWLDETNDPVAEAVAAVQKVGALRGAEYDAWKQVHFDWWHEYYPASFVSIPETQVETVYWTQMYKLGSATRADRVMMDTAGIWQTPSRWPDSHWNFNVQYCYYPLPTANRLDLAQSLVRALHRHRENLVRNVRPVEWQADSAYLAITTGLDLYQPKDIDARAFNNTGGHLVWALHACWLIYRGSMDDRVLRDTVYPILRRAVNYQIRRLEQRDGKYHVPLSHSPEYPIEAPDTNYELSLLRWGCHALLAAAKRLEIDDPLQATWQDILDNLVAYPVDEQTGFMVGAGVPFERNHRHWCHLMMLHPLQLVTGKTAAERELARKSIENFVNVNRGGRDNAPFQYTGTSAMWSLLGKGDKALAEFHRFMRCPVNTPNSMNHYGGANPCLETPIYAAHCIHEMLLQDYDEFPEDHSLAATIRVFPAVPESWADAVFHNLRTPGAFLVSAVRREGHTQWVRVQSLAGEVCRIRPNLPGPVRVAGDRQFAIRNLGDGLYELDLRRGEQAVLYSGDSVPELIVAPLPAKEGESNYYGLK